MQLMLCDLLIKDDVMVAAVLKEIVKNLGHSTREIAATDAEAAVRRRRASPT